MAAALDVRQKQRAVIEYTLEVYSGNTSSSSGNKMQVTYYLAFRASAHMVKSSNPTPATFSLLLLSFINAW
jgi:hypothetical protein